MLTLGGGDSRQSRFHSEMKRESSRISKIMIRQGMLLNHLNEVMIMMGGMMNGMMGGWGMMGYGIFGWVLNLFILGLVVYFAVKLALRDKK